MKFLKESWLATIVSASSLSSGFAFSPIHLVASIKKNLNRHSSFSYGQRWAKPGDDDLSKGMDDAFKQLEGLKDLSGEAESVDKKEKQKEAFAKAMENLDLKDVIDTPPPTSPEKEIKIYEDMASEVAQKDENSLYSEVIGDMQGSKSDSSTTGKGFGKPTTASSGKEDVLSFDRSDKETEELFNAALEQALTEAKKKSNQQIDKDSLLNDKEIMKEIEKIFDRANDQLMEGLDEIRAEQKALAQASIEKGAKESEMKMEEDEERLRVAGENMQKMLDKVNKETKAVESAIEDLRKAQEDLDRDAVGRLSALKSGGIVKQVTLVGTVLFSLRSALETAAFFAGDSSHLAAAIIQAGVALAFFAAFIFL
jgi:uncharacterized protein YukE